MLLLCWQYLTGHAVATDYGLREGAEWPPHPDRAFQALVAAWGAGGESLQEGAALEWLENQPAPGICCPKEEEISRRSNNTFYVPINDGTWSGNLDFGFPAARKKKGRSFPTIWVGNAVCCLAYPNDCSDDILQNLENLCSRVTYLGHSSSLVRMWVTRDTAKVVYVPSDTPTNLNLRVPSPGRFEELVSTYGDGKQNWRRPPVAERLFYVLADEKKKPVAQGPWASDFYIFKQTSGRRLDSTFSPRIANLFRRTLMSYANEEPEGLALISGHAQDGSVLRRDHACIIPLPFVDPPGSSISYGDGHIMGIGIAMPRNISADEKLSVDYILAASANKEGEIVIFDEAIGEMTFELENNIKPPRTLRATTWTHRSRMWASVTPIVIDKMPPKAFQRNREAWDQKVIREACIQKGLPAPSSIVVSDVPIFSGATRCRDFPTFCRHDKVRFLRHAVIIFEEPVVGPLMLGMGKYFGYGLLRPI